MMMSMAKWVGLKNGVKEKLIMGIFVAGVVSGRSFVAVKTAIAATPLSRASVWLFPITSPIANQSAVVKWMKATGERMIKMGWTPENVARIHANLYGAAQLKKRQEAERKIQESGVAECSFCQEEIMKNNQQNWESSVLLEYCTKARDHKHSPKIKWDSDE